MEYKTITNIGIDPSINSTGIYISYIINDYKYFEYWLITQHITKNIKQKILNLDNIYTITEKKLYLNKNSLLWKDNIYCQEYHISYIDIKNKIQYDLYIIEYPKIIITKKYTAYNIQELNKIINISRIKDIINYILTRFNVTNVNINMEGIAYNTGNQSSLVDLAGLNYIIRNAILEHFGKINIYTPAEIKKLATGNGNANKELMIYAWSIINPQIYTLSQQLDIKMDDLADAFFIAQYNTI